MDSVQPVLLALTGPGERLAAHTGDVTFLGVRDLGLPRTTTSSAGWSASFSHGADDPEQASASLPG